MLVKAYLRFIWLDFLLQENKFSQIHYLDADNSPRVLKDRNLNQILDSFKDSFHYYFIDKPKNGDILTNLSKSNDPDGVLIIIDSIRNFINVDFTKDDKITSFLDKLQKLRNLGATMIFYTISQNKAMMRTIKPIKVQQLLWIVLMKVIIFL